MKKSIIIVALALGLGFTGCEDDVKFNDPSFQAQRNYKLWRATNSVAEVKDGTLRVYGTDGVESLVMTIPNYSFGATYDFGNNETNIATYRIIDENISYVFKTGYNLGGGHLTLDPVEKQVPGFISGTFLVKASRVEGGVVVDMKLDQGVFFRIPLREVTAQAPSEIVE
ncbi:DUF6252 family protein [Flavobacterium sp. I3-2]|uniref:DUF6252 family protein n=1 Tax=Flavobacterium sp. I3-2 TaxID=2748319 RepID=UPI0015A95E34|nr:DUF6252 family protein [Flavobacterium sp. I3-2]